MAGSGEVINILLIVGALVFGLLSKMKKAQKQNTTTSMQPPISPSRSFEEEMRDIVREMQHEKQGTITKESATVFEEKKAQVQSKKNYFSHKEQVKDANPIESYESDRADILADIHMSTPDDARKAFIYSEIFNRKY